MKLNYGGLDIEVEIIGGFKIDTKEYAVCSYVDSDDNSKIVIVQVTRNGKDMHVRNIPADEMDLVMARYKEIENELLGGE